MFKIEGIKPFWINNGKAARFKIFVMSINWHCKEKRLLKPDLHTKSNLVETSLADVPAVARAGKRNAVSPETPSGCRWASLWWSDGRPSWRVHERGTCGTHPDATARSSDTAQTSGWRYYNQTKTQKVVKKYQFTKETCKNAWTLRYSVLSRTLNS